MPRTTTRAAACAGVSTTSEARSDGHIRGRTDVPEGFVIERISVTLVGRCPRCRDDL